MQPPHVCVLCWHGITLPPGVTYTCVTCQQMVCRHVGRFSSPWCPKCREAYEAKNRNKGEPAERPAVLWVT